MTEEAEGLLIAAGSASSGAGEGGARGHASTAAATTTSATSADGSSAASNNVSAANASGGSGSHENSTRRVVSPFSQQGATTNEFPPQYLCPFLLGEPPVDGAYFDVPGADNQISEQVFGYSQLYRYIAANGRWPMRSFGEVRHPMNGGWVRRDQALALVRRVSVETQAILTAERTRQGLPLVDSQSITEELRTTYQQMLASVLNPGGIAVAADVVIDGEEDEESDNSSDDDEILDINFRNVSQRTSYNGSGRGSTAGGRGGGGGRASTAGGGRGSTTTGRGRGSTTTTGGRGLTTTGGRGSSTTGGRVLTAGGGRGSTAGGGRGSTITAGGRGTTAGGGRGDGDPTTTSNVAETGGTTSSTSGRRLQPLGPFVGTDGRIRSSDHADGLIGVLQLASGTSPGGIVAALGHNNRTAWIGSHIDAFFRPTGPLGKFLSVTNQTLMRHLKGAETVAKGHWRQHHSGDRTGASQEDVPPWAAAFFPLFSGTDSELPNGAQAAAAREEHRSVVASLAGRQAPLGVRSGPAQLRMETARNTGAPVMRRQIIGNVNAETVYEEGGGEEHDGEFGVEGRHDVAHRRAAPRRRTTNGTRRRNTHLDFSPDGNDPSSRYAEVRGAYSSIGDIARSVSQSMEEPLPSFAELARDYDEIADRRERATDEHRRAFHTMILQGLTADVAARLGTTTVSAIDNAAAYAGMSSASNSAMESNGGSGTENANVDSN